MNLGKMLSDLRRRAGHKQISLAVEIGISREHLSALENNKETNPGFQLLEQLVEACHSNLAEFFAQTAAPRTPPSDDLLHRRLDVILKTQKSEVAREIIDLMFDKVSIQDEGNDESKKEKAS